MFYTFALGYRQKNITMGKGIVYVTMGEAMSVISPLKFNSPEQYRHYAKSNPLLRLPLHPDQLYKAKDNFMIPLLSKKQEAFLVQQLKLHWQDTGINLRVVNTKTFTEVTTISDNCDGLQRFYDECRKLDPNFDKQSAYQHIFKKAFMAHEKMEGLGCTPKKHSAQYSDATGTVYHYLASSGELSQFLAKYQVDVKMVDLAFRRSKIRYYHQGK
ncbi:hypothetical protein D770_05215 [Flammeovirgaceae bacterium 311]|nr:hypothetical protein D770_05215 [Flammeovirgaceae bacterium 311]